MDHVIPARAGARPRGPTWWRPACAATCSRATGTPLEARLRLVREPFHPRFLFSVQLLRHPHASSFLDSWRKYLVAVPRPLSRGRERISRHRGAVLSSGAARGAAMRCGRRGEPRRRSARGELTRVAFALASDFAPSGDQPRAIERLSSLVRAGAPHAVLLGITGQRKNLHPRQPHRRRCPPRPRDLPEQDAGRPALRGVQGLLPGQRRRVLRLLLRLLPARGLHPPVGHLHREGRAHQRRHRPHAPLGDDVIVRAPGRRGGGVGVLHLRHRGARDLPRDARAAASRAGARPRRPDPRPRGHAVRAQRLRLPARDLPGARRRGRDLPRRRRGERDPSGVLRRRASSAWSRSTRCEGRPRARSTRPTSTRPATT